ncbi:hypothetical protein AC70_4804 [Escherichia coli 2-210-07_S4_C1]|nr:hypothetical protein AC70_4804 [Escherichia coli 2-210-07_S4_C1]
MIKLTFHAPFDFILDLTTTLTFSSGRRIITTDDRDIL